MKGSTDLTARLFKGFRLCNICRKIYIYSCLPQGRSTLEVLLNEKSSQHEMANSVLNIASGNMPIHDYVIRLERHRQAAIQNH